MPTVITTWPTSVRQSKHGFDNLDPGTMYQFTKGRDYTCRESSLAEQARGFAKRRGWQCQTATIKDERTGKTVGVALRFTAPGAGQESPVVADIATGGGHEHDGAGEQYRDPFAAHAA